ncbi:MAG: SulP family inorganic anion transporter [Actinomycetia bacterium]|nr:SulP family inorganic anion transporter [Actinomycetes bacterium]
MRVAPRKDVMAGITVGVVALPLALGFGITSGLGAGAGLITAIVAGTIAALFGGSNVQVSGPTGAMVVVLVPIVAVYGANGVLVVGLMAGVLLVGMAFAGVGRYVRFIPLPVIEGFTLGIAVIIALQQIPAALGMTADGEHVVAVAVGAVVDWVANPDWVALSLTVVVVALILGVVRLRPGAPIALIAVIAATLVAQLLDLSLSTIGALPSHFPAPTLPDLAFTDIRTLAVPALAVAALAALESLLSATVADAMRVSDRHNPDRELFGQGLANIASPLFGGIPATAAIARTAVNVRSGATSRLAALVHALMLLVIVLVLADAVSLIPLAALAGVLIATAIRMVEVSSVRVLLRSSRSDTAVLVVTFVATVALDLATAVILGIIAAGALALRQMAKTATLEEIPLENLSLSASGHHSDEERALLAEHVVAYRFEGPLFFGGAHMALLELAEVSDIRVVVLRLSHVTSLDATGAAVLADTIRSLERRDVAVLMSGLPARFTSALAANGVYAQLAARGHVFDHTPEAIDHARKHVLRDPHHANGGAR